MRILKTSSIFALLLFVLLSAQIPLAFAAIDSEGAIYAGGVTNGKKDRIFSLSPESQIQALDKETGTILWESKEASYPFYASENRIYAFDSHALSRNTFRVVTLAQGDGGFLMGSQTVILPTWTAVSLDYNSSPGTSTDIKVKVEKSPQGGAEPVFQIDWTANAFYWGGAAPSRCTELRAKHSAKGRLKIDMSTGETSVQSFEEVPQEPCHESLSIVMSDLMPFSMPLEFQSRTFFDVVFENLRLTGVLPMSAHWPRGGTVYLQAADKTSGATRWSVPLTEYHPLIPPP